MEAIDKVPALVQRLYQIVAELEELFPGRHFTLDGHLVGSIGEVLAAYHYNLQLDPASTGGHDAKGSHGIRVEIKATQGTRVGLRGKPARLIVLRIRSVGTFEEIFNGPGELVWKHAGTRQSNGQRQISVLKLQQLMKRVSPEFMLPRSRT